jgi:hypothetical protein
MSFPKVSLSTRAQARINLLFWIVLFGIIIASGMSIRADEPLTNSTIVRTETSDTTCAPSIITETKESCFFDECLNATEVINETTGIPELVCNLRGDYCRNSTFTKSVITCTKTLYSGLMNYNNGSEIIPINTAIKNSLYGYEMTSAPYRAYFKNNSNTAGAVRFEKDNYFFTYDLSGGALQYRGTPTQPNIIDTLGSGYTSNSKDTQISINGSLATYPNAFSFTNVSYTLYNDMLKEIFILNKPTGYTYKDYTYLEYTGNIKFNKTLTICANEVCYVPSGTQDDFETSIIEEK